MKFIPRFARLLLAATLAIASIQIGASQVVCIVVPAGKTGPEQTCHIKPGGACCCRMYCSPEASKLATPFKCSLRELFVVPSADKSKYLLQVPDAPATLASPFRLTFAEPVAQVQTVFGSGSERPLYRCRAPDRGRAPPVL